MVKSNKHKKACGGAQGAARNFKKSQELQGDVKPHWAMVGALGLVVNFGGFDFGAKFGRHKEIINAPTKIFLAGTEAIGKPRISDGLWVKLAKGINPAGRDEVSDKGALF